MNKITKLTKCLSNPKFYKAYLNGVSPLFELTVFIKQISYAKTLIDVGSNKGQFSLMTRKFFPNIMIHSFEPQIEILNLQKKVLGTNNINYYNYNFALGSEKKELELYITKRKDSSSVLRPILSSNKNYIINEKKKISVKKLDELLDFKSIEKPSIIKLDVQGYELEVLKGSENTLDYIDYVIAEISSTEIYENQTQADELIKFLESKSFEIKDRCNLSRVENKLFQEDVLFCKS